MNSSFSTKTPNLQLGWDNTSISALKTCPRYYYYTIICGYQSSEDNIHLTFGLLYHAALEFYDHQRSQEIPHDEAVLRTVKNLFQTTWDSRTNRPLAVLCEDPNKNRATLIRTVIWYLEQFRNDTLKTIILANGKPAVELSFRFETEFKSAAGEKFIYCGHLDRLIEWEDEFYPLDRKTTKHTISDSFFKQYSPHAQFSGYIFGSQIILPDRAPKKLIVDVAQIEVTFSRFKRGIVARSDFQLDEWYKTLGYWMKLAESFANNNFWPLNETSCNDYGGCPFRIVCAQKTQSVREQFLASPAFKQRIWDPLQIRGDI